MRIVKFSALVGFMFLAITACKKDEPNPPADNDTISIVGKWSMDKVTITFFENGVVDDVMVKINPGWFQFKKDGTGLSYMYPDGEESEVETHFNWVQTDKEIILSKAGMPDNVFTIVSLEENAMVLKNFNETEIDDWVFAVEGVWELSRME